MSSTSSVDTKHPQYLKALPNWTVTRDCVEGEPQIKSRRLTYLPATSGMRAKGMDTPQQEGALMYEAYLTRAVFPELVRPAVNALVGVMHREPATIQLPKALEGMRNNATPQGESLQTLLMRINEQQLITGRIGLLVDVPGGGADVVPYIAPYEAEAIPNWDTSRRADGRQKPDMVVLDETCDERTSRFGWERVEKYLVLDLAVPEPDNPDGITTAKPVYRSQLIVREMQNAKGEGKNRQTNVVAVDSPKTAVMPSLAGRTLDEIPFVFIGSVDLSPMPDQIPMLALARLCLTIYRGEADYRHTLFMQGQDTLVTIGDTPADSGNPHKRIVGSGASIDLPQGGDAKYIGVSSNGLAEQRQAIENDRNRASELGANLLSSSKAGSKEAEETLKIRVAARTATLITVVKAGAEGLQQALRIAAVWKGADPEEVIVTPNMDFVEDSFAPSDLVDMMTAKRLGAPIALQSVHAWMKDKDVTALEFDEELRLIDEEEPQGTEPSEEERARLLAEEQAAAAAAKTQTDPQEPEDEVA